MERARYPFRPLWPYLLCAATGAVYLALIFTLPTAGAAPYGIAAVSSFVALKVGPPLMAVTWLVGCRAAMLLLAAAASMRDRRERTAYRRIVAGIFFLIGGTAATFLMRISSAHLLAAHRAVAVALLVASNSVSVFGQCVGFVLIDAGSRGVPGALEKERKPGILPEAALSAGVATLAVAVVWSVFTNPTRSVAAAPRLATYFLPDVGIFFLVVLPFLVACAVGLFSAVRFIGISRAVSGDIYKRTTRWFTLGMLLQFVGWILFQAYLSIGSARLSGLGAGWVTLAIVPFTLCILVGYALIAVEARKTAAAASIMEEYGGEPEPPKEETPFGREP